MRGEELSLKVDVETKRQGAHILFGFCPFLLKYLEIWDILAGAFFALIFIILILPKISKFGFRAEDIARGYPMGAVYYTFSIIISLLVFPVRIAASSWVIMAFGDGAATLVGRGYGKRKVFWNQDKTYVGFVSFILFAWVGAVGVNYWLSNLSPLPWWATFEILPANFNLMLLINKDHIVFICLLTSFFCAVIESLPTKINDNLAVPISGSIFMFFLSQII